jgi:membrane protein DedA with SNARE-associated domain
LEQFLNDWGPLGVFLGIIATGLGFPMPEELPVVLGGALVNKTNAADPRWWFMLLACILGVLVGDSCLYLIGRFWGVKLVKLPFIKKHLLPPERLVTIKHNFEKYGVKILLFARLTPGIRAPIFITAGITKLPWAKFFFADGIYAVPGVSLLFFLGYWFTDNMVYLIQEGESKLKPIIIIVVLLGVVGYFVYRHLRKPVVEGSPKEMPPVVGQVTNVVGQVTNVLDQGLHTVKDKIMHTGEHRASAGDIPPPPASHPAAHESGSPWVDATRPAPPVTEPNKPNVKPVVIAGVVVALTGYFYIMYRLLRGRALESAPTEPPLVVGPATNVLESPAVSTGSDSVPVPGGATPLAANGQALPGSDPIPRHPASEQSH